MSQQLFSEFNASSLSDWNKKITADLKGKDFNETLVWKTIEGFDLQPNYTSENSPEINLQATESDWEINQNILVENVADANQKALIALNEGVSSLSFHFLGKVSEKDFSALLDGVMIEYIQINLGSKYPLEVLSFLKNYCAKKDIRLDKINGSITFDILYHITVAGNWLHNESTDFDMLKSLIENSKEMPNFKTVGVYSDSFHNAGSNTTQEIGLTISKANEYISQLVDLGLSSEDVINNTFFHLPIGNSYFVEIGKLKALNLLWKNLCKAYDSTAEIDLKCSTSSFYNSSLDAYNNLLRATSQSMAAVLGGANSLTVTPYNTTFEKNTPFGDRIAKNIQLILKEEAYFNKVNDPTAGNYYLNEITHQLSENAWQLFQEIEEEGGFIVSHQSGFVLANIQIVADKRIERFNNEEDVLLGVNKYANSADTPQTPFTNAEVNEETEFPVLRPFRIAQQFELETESVK